MAPQQPWLVTWSRRYGVVDGTKVVTRSLLLRYMVAPKDRSTPWWSEARTGTWSLGSIFARLLLMV